MKSFFAMLAFVAFSVVAAQAQIIATITNNTNCDYKVKVNHVPTSTNTVTGTGPVVVVAAGATINVTVLSFVPPGPGGVPHHVPAFGVNENTVPCPPVIVGYSSSPYPLSVTNYCNCAATITYGGTPTAPTLTIN